MHFTFSSSEVKQKTKLSKKPRREIQIETWNKDLSRFNGQHAVTKLQSVSKTGTKSKAITCILCGRKTSKICDLCNVPLCIHWTDSTYQTTCFDAFHSQHKLVSRENLVDEKLAKTS
jgi:hypothetical protein